MARITLDLPDHFAFVTELRVSITHINYAGHVGNDVLLGLLHEARFQFMSHHGLQELNVEGLGIIVADSVIVYKSEAFVGETLLIAVGATDFNRYGCDFIYHVTEKASGREVARAKTGIVFFDYGQRVVAKIPTSFLALFPRDVAVV